MENGAWKAEMAIKNLKVQEMLGISWEVNGLRGRARIKFFPVQLGSQEKRFQDQEDLEFLMMMMMIASVWYHNQVYLARKFRQYGFQAYPIIKAELYQELKFNL